MHTLAMALVLVLRAYDMRGVPPHEMAEAERAAAGALRRARIDLAWVACRPAHITPLPCNDVPQPAELIVRLVATPSALTQGVLGDAHVDTESASGRFATVYVDRVRSLASAAGVDPGALIGRVIAHEVGHLLLGTSSHSATGLMRPAWSAPALRRDGAVGWSFTDREAERLRNRLNARLELDRIGRTALIEPTAPSQPCSKGRGLACPGR